MKPKSEMKPLLKKKQRKRKNRIDLGRSCGVTRYEYEMSDDIELLMEIGFLIQCDMIDGCPACRLYLNFA